MTSEYSDVITLELAGHLCASHGYLLLNDSYLEEELVDLLQARRTSFGAPEEQCWGDVVIRVLLEANRRGG